MNKYDFSSWGAPPARPSFWFHKSPSAILLLASVIIGVLWLIPVKPTQARPNLTYNRLVWTGAQVVTQQPTGGGTNSNWTKDEDYFVINLDPVAPKAELIRVAIESQPIPGEPICQSTAGGYPPVRPLYLNTSGKWQGAFDANVVDPIEKIVIHCNTYNGGNASRKMLVTQVTLVVSTVPTSTPVPTNTPTRTPTPQPTGTPIRPTNTPFPTPTPERYTIAGHILDEQGTPAVEDVQFIVMDHSTGSPMPRVPLIDGRGAYTLSGFINGNYTVQPELTSPALSAQSICADPPECEELYIFSPISRTYISLSGNQTNQDYTLIRTPGYTITGQISETITSTTHPISGVTILANNAYSATTDSTGHYTLTKLVTGSYTLSPTFSTTQTNALFVPPVRVVEITSGMTMTRLITGQDFVRWHRYPVTGLITGALITEAVVSAYLLDDTWQETRAEVGATGHYTFATLLAGRYSFTATHADYQFVSDDPLVQDVVTDTVGPTFRQIDSSGMYTISGRVTEYGSDTPIAEVSISIQDGTTTTTDVTGYYTFTDLAEGTYNLTATGQGFTFKPKVAEIVLTRDRGDVKQDFEGESIIIPNIPKGANFLSFDNIADDANHNVGWNLDQIRHVIDYENLRANISTAAEQHDVKSIIRLENYQYPDHGQPPSLDLSLGCEQLDDWMGDLNDLYQIKLNPDTIQKNTIFILANEPNHPTDEWAYTAKEYAFVYNCYYQEWKKIRQNGHKLYVAGPAQDARQDIQNWRGFLDELFGSEGITETDGFAMHVYGYYQHDNNGDLFKAWLDKMLAKMSQRNHSEEGFIITEYNPGHSNTQILVNGWEDWFKRTYCWSAAGQMSYGVDIDGLLYFADKANAERQCTPGPWYDISLCEPTRRAHWLGLNNNFDNLYYTAPTPNKEYSKWCKIEPEQRSLVSYNNSSSANPSNQSSLVTTGGVVSGTLAGGMRFDGVTGGRKYVYVYDDLIVPEGETLIIPGDTDIVFESDYRIIVAGQFLADRWGDVLFTTHSSRGWKGIQILPTSSGSRCIRCQFENLAEGATALEIEAPITLIEGRISNITNGIAISSTVPFTMANILIDHAKTGLHLSGPLTQSHTFNHITIADCKQGIINQGQNLTLENSIIANCDEGIRTEQLGNTNVRYSLLYNNQNFVTTGTLQIGLGMRYTDPLFQVYKFSRDLPGSYHLSEESPAVDAADPQADHSKEPRFSGDRADMGAWGNTGYATYRIPYEKMGIALSATPLTRTAHPGDILTFTVTVTNTGELTQDYVIDIADYSVRTSFTTSWDYDFYYSSSPLSPKNHGTHIIWSYIPLTLSTAITNPRIKVHASNTYIEEDVYLQINIPHIPEENGQLYLEAEEYMRQVPAITSTVSQPHWITQSIITGYVGHGYVTALPDTGLEITTPLSSPLNQGRNGEYDSPKLSYTIHFTTPGRYHVWLRGYAADAESDAVYVALDNQAAQLMSSFPKMRWSWWHKNQVDTPVTIAIPKDETGLHTFNIWMAEDGFRLDRILLTLEGDYIPAGRGPTKGEGNQAHLLPPAVGGFETGTLVGWELPYPGVTLAEGSAYQDQYGLKLNGRGRLDYTFETIPGTTYQVSAWVRLDEVISPPSWGGLLLQAVDIPSWHQLGRSAYLHAGSHPTGQTLPLGVWHYVTFRFEAVGSTSRIIYQNFSDGELGASADEFQVLPLAEPNLLARSSRLLRRSYAVHLPVVRGGTGLSEAVLADRLLAWELAWANGQRPDLPVELARAYGVGD